MRRRSIALRIILVATCSISIGLVGNLATNTVSIRSKFIPLIWLAVILLWLATVIGEMREKLGRDANTQPPSSSLASVADQLAQAVTMSWRLEEERQRLSDPFPLPVRWKTVHSRIVDQWANICRAGPSEDARPLTLDDDLTSILKVYRQVPSGRLAILGKGGSGKTILVIRLLLDLMTQRVAGATVPVVFNFGSWDPTSISLRNWLAAQLIRDHPGLFIRESDGRSIADALINANLILPILDGFDEINEHLRCDALVELNKSIGPIVVTSRSAEYVSAVKSSDVLTAAAVIAIGELTVGDLEPYLRRASRNLTHGDGPTTTTWDPVIARLKKASRSPEAGRLVAALSTPLMASLARRIYSDFPDSVPSELLDSNRFKTRLAIERHLLNAFISAVYRRPLDRHLAPKYVRWEEEDATRWLSYLAAHLNSLKTSELAWWEIRESVGASTRKVIFCVIFGLMGVVAVLPIIGSKENPLGLLAVLGGVSYGMVAGTLAGSRIEAPQPTQTETRVRGRMNRLRKGIGNGLAFGAKSGFLFGLVFSVVTAISSSLKAYADIAHTGGEGFGLALSFGLVNGIILGLFVGISYAIGAAIAVGLALGVVFGTQDPINIEAAVSPFDSLRRDRQQALWITLLVGIGMSVWFGIGSGANIWIIPGIFTGICFGFSVGLYRTAWGHWLLIARIWLPITGRTPWRIGSFLTDAHARGVLRQNGAVYQFRHARLQDQLAVKDGRGKSA